MVRTLSKHVAKQLSERPRIVHGQDFPTIEGWSVDLSAKTPSVSAEPTSNVVWSDERGFSISQVGPAGSKRMQVTFGTDISMEVDGLQRRVSNTSWRELNSADAHHFLADQVYPRILAQEGALIVHAGSFISRDRSVLLLGPSGRGKSTLIASFDQSGFVSMGDDACWISNEDGFALAESLYPSLRLFQDSLAAVFAGTIQTAPVGSHTMKRRVAPRPYLESRKVPVAAVFSIAEARSDEITVQRLSNADACMTCVENSFALDPSNAAQAAWRLKQASYLARAVPFFEIAYPRDYARLPEVRRAILDQVALLEPA